MVNLDEDALICDMAEAYGVFDMYSLPAPLVATLAVGLRDDSRIKTRMMNMNMPLSEYLLAAIFDDVNWLCWTHTKEAEKGRGTAPQRILSILLERDEKKEDSFLTFGTAEEFESARRKILGENNG